MKIILSFFSLLLSAATFSQLKKVELYNLVKKLVQDSSGYSTVGDWAVSKPAAFPIKWQADRIEMSDDMKINFFRKGTANITVNGSIPIKWNVMLKGPRSGFSSFSISSENNKTMKAKTTIDSLFGKKPYSYTLLKDCAAGLSQGFYYYQLKMPKKTMTWIKISWVCSAGNCSLTLDCYDDWSKQYADLSCAK